MLRTMTVKAALVVTLALSCVTSVAAFPILPHSNPLQSAGSGRIASLDVSAAALSHRRRRRFRSSSLMENQNSNPNISASSSSSSSSSSSTTTSTSLRYSLNSIETLCVNSMDQWYSKSLAIKCPFLRRRMSDILDALDKVMRFVIIRHKSLDLIGPPLSCRCSKMSKAKCPNLSIQQLADIIRKDWKEDTMKGYYITGKLNTTIYRDDCLFDGPDPDMPVRGLRKYINAASQLFEHQTSTAILKSLEIVDQKTIKVCWELSATLHLPWHPKLPVWTGSTTYHVDEDGLVYFHEDAWDMSVFQAFTETFFPNIASRVWNNQQQTRQPQS